MNVLDLADPRCVYCGRRRSNHTYSYGQPVPSPRPYGQGYLWIHHPIVTCASGRTYRARVVVLT